MKPIICPECIATNEKPDDHTGVELQDVDLDNESTVKVFNDWKSYAYHILKEHPESHRIEWVITSVNDEVVKYETKQKQQEQLERTKKQVAAQYHFQEYTRITQELEAS